MPIDYRDEIIALDLLLGVYGDEDDGTGRPYSETISEQDVLALLEDDAAEVDRRWGDFNFGSKSHR